MIKRLLSLLFVFLLIASCISTTLYNETVDKDSNIVTIGGSFFIQASEKYVKIQLSVDFQGYPDILHTVFYQVMLKSLINEYAFFFCKMVITESGNLNNIELNEVG